MANLGSTGRYFAHNSAHAFSPVLRTAHKMPSLLSNFFSLWMLQFSHILEPSQPFLANISWRNFPKNSSTWLGILVHNLNLEFLIHGDFFQWEETFQIHNSWPWDSLLFNAFFLSYNCCYVLYSLFCIQECILSME